ncbi:methyltransferase domain-containing protein [Geobacter sp. AOG1]|uniref:class I SAM-dependent methyltransferase n=1 Tax=Geobacter sp. AOG1 TaxID=1566346 RepID=UPI001CC41B7F|nr:methyltransferase domain-containing protein [Geobacter sp. AOG1]GFE58585.1 hypothetical protein AOG1_24650 [Geobacter sp. AOG1]
MITRLQLGTSRLENLKPEIRKIFLDKSWLHFGDPENERVTSRGYTLSYLCEVFKRNSLSFIMTKAFQLLIGKRNKTSDWNAKINDLYSATNFREFYYTKGDRLPFDDNSLDFIYSEHFFEHLFFDEALSLMQECYRVLKPFGVIRTCVPDADLRTYELPEDVGFPDSKLPFNDPGKHKTRWSVYSFGELLRFAGFEPIPLRYCDKLGQYIKNDPSSIPDSYKQCPEQELISDLSYIDRIDSLIVDGLKKTAL